MALLPAAIAIILNKDQTEVLLIKRQDISIWVLPGGGIEKGEMPEEALIREVEEETGYQIQIQRQCAVYSPINYLAALTHVFICSIQSGTMRLSAETAAIAFYPLKKLPASFFPPHAQWLKEGISHQNLIQRSLTEISYREFLKYFIRHPWQVGRFAWTRFTKS